MGDEPDGADGDTALGWYRLGVRTADAGPGSPPPLALVIVGAPLSAIKALAL